jgi:hypothetical protein
VPLPPIFFPHRFIQIRAIHYYGLLNARHRTVLVDASEQSIVGKNILEACTGTHGVHQVDCLTVFTGCRGSSAPICRTDRQRFD